jgi:hypothetical protein
MNKDKNVRDILLERYPYFFEEQSAYSSHIPKGWEDLFFSFLEEADSYIKKSDKNINFKILQFKQKWFNLVIYYSGADDYLSDLVKKTEKAAANYCNSCGVSGDIHTGELQRGRCSECKNDSW